MLSTVAAITHNAQANNYAVAAANVGSSVEITAAIEAAEEANAPLVLDVLQENILPCPKEFCVWARAMCEMASVPVALNIDDGKSFSGALEAIANGASSVMVHRANMSLDDNISEVKNVTAIAHGLNISVEAAVNFDDDTEPAQLRRFVEASGADCVAFGIRKTGADGAPYLDLTRLAAIREAVGDCPLVLHGTLGIPAEQIEAACRLGINKVNFSKELKAASLREITEHAGEDTPVNLLKSGFKKKLFELISLCSSSGKAQTFSS